MTKVLIAISTRSEQARYTDFFQSIYELDLSGLDCKIRLFQGWFSWRNKNNAVAFAQKYGYEYIFFVDDDQLFPPSALKKLLAADKDIISCNLINRTPPFHPYLFLKTDENGVGEPAELNGAGIIEVAACGIGGVLIKTKVFDTAGLFGIDNHVQTEDLFFYREARKVGYSVYVDLDMPSGHIATCAVWPQMRKDDWGTTIVMNNIMEIQVPKAKRVDKDHMGIPGAQIR